jgi:Flp pilus assembly protein TadG
MASRFTRLMHDASGVVYVETAVSLLILSLTILAGIEIGRYVLLAQKIDRAVASVADIAAQGQTISVADLNNLFSAAIDILKPFSLEGVGTVIVSSVSTTGANPPVVDWQRAGGSTLSIGSAIGVAGGTATLPAELTVRAGEEVIVAEVYYNFTPWLAPEVAPAAQLYNRAFYRPRQGPLTTLQP